MKPEDTVYLVMACRHSTDDDMETDIIINGKHIIIDAIERVNMLELDKAEEKLSIAFPNHFNMITHLPLLHMIDIAIKLQNLESELALNGDVACGSHKPSRIADAFNWQNKYNPMRQKGSC